MPLAQDIEQTLLRLLSARDVHASICPSEVARALEQDQANWRALMPSVRAVATHLASSQIIDITQRGQAVDMAAVSGPVRLRRGAAFEGQH